MNTPASEALQKVEIKKVIGPTSAGAAILLGNEDKTFVIFIGFYEATATFRKWTFTVSNEWEQEPIFPDFDPNFGTDPDDGRNDLDFPDFSPNQ